MSSKKKDVIVLNVIPMCVRWKSKLEPGETSLAVLDLKPRTFNFFARRGVETVEKMAEFSYEELRRIHKVGVAMANDVRDAMHRKGYRLKGEEITQSAVADSGTN